MWSRNSVLVAQWISETNITECSTHVRHNLTIEFSISKVFSDATQDFTIFHPCATVPFGMSRGLRLPIGKSQRVENPIHRHPTNPKVQLLKMTRDIPHSLTYHKVTKYERIIP